MKTPFLVVVDADSTLIEDEVIELLAAAASRGREVTEITQRAMAGEVNFEESLRERVAMLAGLPITTVFDVATHITLTHGATDLVAALHECGGLIGVVSGGFHEILDPLVATLGLDHCRANRLAVDQGRLTGALTGPLIGPKAKASALSEWAGWAGVPLTRTVAVGDGANDVEMMSVAGLSVAFDAKPLVKDHADLVIDERDLSQVLPLLGLRG